MNYLSVCSGIEAASVAWHGLGWNPVGFSEIEPFPSAVLQNRFPGVKNFGDMTKFKEWKNVGTVDLLVGGTPCQSFSVAGLRKGLTDPRGNLMLTFGAIAHHFKARWVVWENVPGVLSSNKGRDFGAFLGMLAQLGYGFAYRVLDAQFFGVPQRRRRVFVVGCLGDWRPPARALFDSASLSGGTQPGGKNRQNAPGGLAGGVEGKGGVVVMAHGQANAEILTDTAPSLTCNHEAPIVLMPNRIDAPPCRDRTPTLEASHHPAVCYNGILRWMTPMECERAQGFPDNWTQIPWRGKPADKCPDYPRYRAVGNSMAVPVMRWIGERIDKQEKEQK
jgi:DNA (cytosine-5)-methyltransferase 1